MTDVSLFWPQDKGSRALNRAFYYDNVNIKAEKIEIIGLKWHFFEKNGGLFFFWGGGGWGCLRRQVVTCLRRQPQIFLWPIFFWLFACVILSTLSGLWLSSTAKKASIEEFSPIFLFSFGVNDRCFFVLAPRQMKQGSH